LQDRNKQLIPELNSNVNNDAQRYQMLLGRSEEARKGLLLRVEQLENQALIFSNRIQERDEENKELAKTAAKTTSSSSDLQEIEQLFHLMKAQIPQYVKQVKDLSAQNSSLQHQIDYLKAMKENVEKVKEEKRGLEHQLTLMSQLSTENAQLKIQLQEREYEKSEWTQFLHDNGSR
jgi:hypothetical protein